MEEIKNLCYAQLDRKKVQVALDLLQLTQLLENSYLTPTLKNELLKNFIMANLNFLCADTLQESWLKDLKSKSGNSVKNSSITKLKSSKST